jgi:DNA-binding SARP family transcriptional activator
LFSLNILGGAVLEENGQPVTGGAVRRHPLALLAIVATAKTRAVSRETLISLLWPNVSASVGRNRLTSTLYLIRKRFAGDVLLSTGDEVKLDPNKISCDVWQFRQAMEEQNFRRASEAYAGPLLQGFYLDESLPFEDWARSQREELHDLWCDAVAELAEIAAGESKYAEAARYWQFLAEDDPLDSSKTERRIEALVAAGKKKEAVDAAEAHAARLHREIGNDAEDMFRQSIAELDVDTGGTTRLTIKRANGIAVLPFETLAGTEDRILAEGVHRGVLTRLSDVEDIGVIANVSLQRFLNTSSEMANIASSLSVRWVVEGDVQTFGGSVRVGVRLIDAPVERQTWGHEYVAELKADQFFDVLASIAADIVDNIHVELSAKTASSIARRPTESLEAYRLATRGRLRLDLRGAEDMQVAVKHFEQAVEVDPEFALGWIGLADAIGLAYAYGYTDPSGLPRAEAAINKALECDPNCAEAHAALGRFLGQQGQSVEAMDELRKAVTLKPGYAEGFSWMTIGLQLFGDIKGAVKSSQRAVRLNPLSSEALNNLCSSYVFAGRYADAIRTAEDAQELDEYYDGAQFFGAIARYEERRFREALDMLETLNVLWAGSGVATVRALCHAENGQQAAARELLEQVHDAGHVFDEGLILAALGDFDAAEPAFEASIFNGPDFATSYWPTISVRYLFRRVWDAIPDASWRISMLDRINEAHG